jgi:3-deoxy-D-manno-octulosonic-acid transferase
VPFEEETARWEGLGVPSGRITLTGSVKFDEDAGPSQRPDDQIAGLSDWLAECGVNGPHRILLAGSTHAGEEALIGKVYLALRKRFPDLVYVAVPRHAERARQVVADLREIGLVPVLKKPVKGIEARNSLALQADSEPSLPRCFIANTTGELRAWYYLAEVVVVGKSFGGRGGQNPIEPVVAGKPVVVGPHMSNFSAVVRNLVAREGIIQLESADQLEGTIARLLESGADAAAYPRRGREALRGHRGATGRTVRMIREAALAGAE